MFKKEGNSMVDISLIVIVYNTLVVLTTFIVPFIKLKLSETKYRLLKGTLTQVNVWGLFRKYMKAERSELADMDRAELEKFLDYL